ncbi:MAG: peptide-methionine (S)-S-oxide reductase, partial [Xanthobacteraceae bacterium]|nr:peptide-methionine (S)-S-oxide reductase [Xanthobacteraceae bacterium]
MFLFKKSLEMPAPGQALPGRPRPILTAAHHFINGHGLK